MKNRIEVLRRLIAFEGSIKLVQSDLSDFEWDYNREEIILLSRDLEVVLKKFCDGDISENDLELWANLVECREDIGLEENHEDQLSRIIFHIANQKINGPVDFTIAKDWIKKLKRHNKVDEA